MKMYYSDIPYIQVCSCGEIVCCSKCLDRH